MNRRIFKILSFGIMMSFLITKTACSSVKNKVNNGEIKLENENKNDRS